MTFSFFTKCYMLCYIFCTNSLSFYSYCCKKLADEDDGSPQNQTLHNERLETNIWEPPVPRLSNVHFHVQLPEERKCDCGYCVCGRERDSCTHTCTRACTHVHMRTCTHMHAHACVHAHMHRYNYIFHAVKVNVCMHLLLIIDSINVR